MQRERSTIDLLHQECVKSYPSGLIVNTSSQAGNWEKNMWDRSRVICNFPETWMYLEFWKTGAQKQVTCWASPFIYSGPYHPWHWNCPVFFVASKVWRKLYAGGGPWTWGATDVSGSSGCIYHHDIVIVITILKHQSSHSYHQLEILTWPSWESLP